MTKFFKIFLFTLAVVFMSSAVEAAVTFSDMVSNSEYGTSLKVRWDLLPSPGKNYKVIYYPESTPVPQHEKNVGIDAGETVITGLNANTNYIFRILADESDISGNVSTTTLAMELLDERFAPEESEFVWIDTAPDKASSYRLEYSKNADMSGAVVVPTVSTVYSPGSLEPNTVYYYRVGAINSSGAVNYKKNENGDEIIFSTMTLPTPPSTLRFEAAGGAVFESSVTVRWNSASPASVRGTHLYLEASKNALFSSGIIRSAMLNTSQTQAAISGLNPNTIYYFRVSAENAMGAVVYTPSISTMTLAPKIFTDPSVLTLSATWGAITADFAPLPAENCNGYRLEVSTSQAFTAGTVKYAEGNSSANSLTITGLDYTTYYFVRMITKNNAGAGNITNLGGIATLSVGAPKNISFKTIHQSSATLRFDTITPSPEEYIVGIYRGDGTIQDYSTLVSSTTMPPILNTEEQTFTITGLNMNSQYSARVSAKYGMGYEDSDKADRSRWTLPATVPTPSITNNNIYASSFTVSYETFSLSGAYRFRLDIYKGNFSGDPVVTLYETPDEGHITAGSTFDNTIEPNTRYYVRGAMVNAESEGIFVPVNVWPIITKAVLPEFDDFITYPSSITVMLDPSDNPAGTFFTVECYTNPDYTALAKSTEVSNPQKGEIFPVIFEGLNPETLYYIRANAKNSAGFSTADWKKHPRSVSTKASTPDPKKKKKSETVYELTSEGYSSSSTTITVEWPGSYDNSYGTDPNKRYAVGTHFKIRYSSSGFNDNTFKVFSSSRTGTQRQEITGLQSNSTYQFRLSVLTQNIEPDDTESSVVDMAEFYTEPSDPEAIAASTEAYTAVGFDTFTANWKQGNNSPDSEYEIYTSSHCQAGDIGTYAGLCANYGPHNPYAQSSCQNIIDNCNPHIAIVRGLNYKFNNLDVGTSYYTLVRTKGIKKTAGNNVYSHFILIHSSPAETKTETDNMAIIRDKDTVISIPAFHKQIMLKVPAFSISSNLGVIIKPMYKDDFATYPSSTTPFVSRPAVAGEKLLSGNLGIEIRLSTATETVQYVVSKPMTLILPYEPGYLESSIDDNPHAYGKAHRLMMPLPHDQQEKLLLARFDDTSKTWNPVETVSDPDNNTLTAKIWNFGLYQIMKTTALSTFAKVRIYPNPYRPNTNYGVVHFENLPDINGKGSKVKIFTILGELVREIDSPGTSTTWDGLNKNGNKAGSGIYIVFIQSKDNPSVSKTYKLAIER
jgi:hypothetical protein